MYVRAVKAVFTGWTNTSVFSILIPMFASTYNIVKARQWQEKRRRIRSASGAVKLRLLQSFGDEIRALPPVPAASAPEPVSLFNAVLGAWLNIDPANPDWPGRDRLFVVPRADLVNACALLAVCGFFAPEKLPDLVESIGSFGLNTTVPGLESPGIAVEEIPRLLWESAVASGRDKRRWREASGSFGHDDWFSSAWRDAPESWRTCVVLDSETSVAAACRELAGRREDQAVGLVALVNAPEACAAAVVADWESSGWRAVMVGARDSMRLHGILAEATLEQPLAVVLSVAAAGAGGSAKAVERRVGGAELLGEMSDEAFTALFDESLKLGE